MGNGTEVKIGIHPSGEKIIFREQEHTYETEKCKDFVSCTTFIGSFFEEFDTETISANYARKHGLDQAEVIRMWEEKKVHACELGTKVHFFCEKLMEGQPCPAPSTEEETALFRVAANAVSRLKNKYEFVSTEAIVFSNKYRLAGMIDLLMRDPVNGDLLILDWKTNKKIQFENRWRRGFDPIRHLEDTSFNHYSLQLSLYKKIMTEEGYFDGNSGIRLGLIHLTHDKPVWLKVDAMDTEIEQMLAFRLNELAAFAGSSEELVLA